MATGYGAATIMFINKVIGQHQEITAIGKQAAGSNATMAGNGSVVTGGINLKHSPIGYVGFTGCC